MIHVNNLIFKIPAENPAELAARLDGGIRQTEANDNSLLRLIFIVSPNPRMLRGETLSDYKRHVEPYRSRARRACLENVIVVENPIARVAARAALKIFRPDVPTRVVKSYFA